MNGWTNSEGATIPLIRDTFVLPCDIDNNLNLHENFTILILSEEGKISRSIDWKNLPLAKF